MTDFFADAFNFMKSGYNTVDDWFDSAKSFVDSESTLKMGAKAVKEVIGAQDQSSQSLLDKVTSSKMGGSGRTSSGEYYQPGKVKTYESEDFFTWEKRWLDRLHRFHNPDKSQVKLG